MDNEEAENKVHPGTIALIVILSLVVIVVIVFCCIFGREKFIKNSV